MAEGVKGIDYKNPSRQELCLEVRARAGLFSRLLEWYLPVIQQTKMAGCPEWGILHEQLGYSLELGFKSLVYCQRGEWCRGHGLRRLFEKLDDSVRRSIDDTWKRQVDGKSLGRLSFARSEQRPELPKPSCWPDDKQFSHVLGWMDESVLTHTKKYEYVDRPNHWRFYLNLHMLAAMTHVLKTLVDHLAKESLA